MRIALSDGDTVDERCTLLCLQRTQADERLYVPYAETCFLQQLW
jgi:hypothetical protein